MPPPRLRRLLGLGHQARSTGGGPTNTEQYFSAESNSWKSPDDILSILMIIGGDIVQRAVAQLAGSGPWHFAPVAFSFGWLAYSVSALTSAVGDGRLLPPPDIAAYVVNARTGYVRENASWVVCRLMRDHEKRTFKGGSLTVAFYRTRRGVRAGVPARDWVYWSGVLVILAQLAIALIPGALHGNWIVLIVTAGGTALALTASGLPQWREEKYAAREVDEVKGREVVCVTRGNGSTFAMVIISDRTGLRFEDLAGGRDKRRPFTAFMSAVLCLLWIVLLLTVEGLQGDAWYLLAIGGLGMVQNVVAAGAQRSAEALGFYFEPTTKDDIFKEAKVMQTLKRVEEKEPGVGLSMLPIFFPGDLRPDEQAYWDAKKLEKAARETAGKRTPPAQTLPKDPEKVPRTADSPESDLKTSSTVSFKPEVRPETTPPLSQRRMPRTRREDTGATLVDHARP
ncbi:hypothetical protein C2E23DRAFT_486539 [Lenzites betulinus]|nr:hypothetical protein C2E23DRAFT_486539 [Lenzites betulinus]